jgi:hypothetical protein
MVRFCNLTQVSALIEPAELCSDSARRPDIQVALPTSTLLGDVTITHPSSKTWRKVAAKRSVDIIGDRREAEKAAKYAAMAADNDMHFQAIVLYTYGGFHSSALLFISQVADSVDPYSCPVSRAEWLQGLKQHIAIAVQRGNADIMIQHSQRSLTSGRSLRRRPPRHKLTDSASSGCVRGVASSGFAVPARRAVLPLSGQPGPGHIVGTSLMEVCTTPPEPAVLGAANSTTARGGAVTTCLRTPAMDTTDSDRVTDCVTAVGVCLPSLLFDDVPAGTLTGSAVATDSDMCAPAACASVSVGGGDRGVYDSCVSGASAVSAALLALAASLMQLCD